MPVVLANVSISLRRLSASEGSSVQVSARDYLVVLEKFFFADESVTLAVNDDDDVDEDRLVSVVSDDYDGIARLNSCTHERARE